MIFDQRIFGQRRFDKGDVIFAEGAPGDNCYVIKQGQVRIERRKGEGAKVLGVMSAGCLFGEMALIDDMPRMATATAVEETLCVVITRDQFREKLDAADPFIKALLRILVQCARLPSL